MCYQVCLLFFFLFPISPIPVTFYDTSRAEKIDWSGRSGASSDALKGLLLFAKTKDVSALCWEREAILELQRPVAGRWFLQVDSFSSAKLHWFGTTHTRTHAHAHWTMLSDSAVLFPFKLAPHFLADTCLNQCLPRRVIGLMFYAAPAASQIH